ncbi:MAG: ribonuclease J [Actinobacteria bacterium]|nr:ribonuclease J [Actinomycetota bacterium]MCL6087360.1 ribonuclease J [Actinomycetota bacterium]
MSKRSSIKLIPLGGFNEIGKNMMVLEKDEDMIIIDCGVMFPDEDFPGVDYIIPDFSYVKRNVNKLRAIIITHGHEDHIGGIPFLFKEVMAPVYATKLTKGLIELKLNEHQIFEGVQLNEIDEDDMLNIGPFTIEFFRVSHSIPDTIGIAIKTDVGTILHSGDFKFDQSPLDGKITEFSKIGTYGREGVLVLLCDSTNSEEEGFTLSERDVGKTLLEKFTQAEGRVIVTTFSSHIHRIQQIVDMSEKFQKKLAISGKSLLKTIKIACELGYLKIPEDLIIPINKIDEYPLKKITILATGTQGEPLSALYKMAVNEHKRIQIMKSDMVIISASPIPGNEKAIANIINMLIKHGADVYYESIAGVHVSGHAAQEEIKMMINLVRPRYFIPIHGDNMHKVQNGKIAQEVGIPEENIVIAQNGDVIKINSNLCRVSKNIDTRTIYVDGLGFGDIDDIVLRDRKLLSRDGVVLNIIGVDLKKEEIFCEPDLTFKGVTFLENFDSIIKECKNVVTEAVNNCFKNNITTASTIEKYANDRLEKYLIKKIRLKPVVITKILSN